MGARKNLLIPLIVLLVVIAAGSAIYFSGTRVPGNVKSGKFQTVTIDRGEVVQTTSATGVVESENEVLVLSPAASIVKNILKEPGNQVKAGEVILQLYTQPVEDEIEKLKDQLEMKKTTLKKHS